MKWLLILAVLTDNGFVSSQRERSMGEFATLAGCRAAGHALLLRAAPLLGGDVVRIDAFCERRGGAPDAAEDILGRAAP